MLVRGLMLAAGKIDTVLPTLRSICSSCQLLLDQNWRIQRGLPDNPNRNATLRDTPDYSFVDGRPTPYGSRHRFRILKQREYTAKIMELTQEIDYAVERHAKLEEEKRKKIEGILSRKLKKKGNKPLTE